MLNSEPHPGSARRAKRAPAAMIAVTLIVLLSPIVENWKANPTDSFPLSYFPMFSARRGDTFKGESIVGIDSLGNRRILDYQFAGSGGFNQVRRQIRAKVKAKQADDLCVTVAKRVGRSRNADLKEVHTVEVLSVTQDVDAFFAGNREPRSKKLHAACEVPGRQSLANSNVVLTKEVQ